MLVIRLTIVEGEIYEEFMEDIKMTLRELLEQNTWMEGVFKTAIENKLEGDNDIIDVDVSHHSRDFEFYIDYDFEGERFTNGYSYNTYNGLKLIQYSLGKDEGDGVYSFFVRAEGLPKKDFLELINELITNIDII